MVNNRLIPATRRTAAGFLVAHGLCAAGLDEVGDASEYGTLRRLYDAGRV